MVSGKEARYSDLHKSEFHDSAGRFSRKTASPMALEDVESEFEDLRRRRVRPQPATADMFAGGKEEHRPVLDPARVLSADLNGQPFRNLLSGERAADESCYVRIPPQFHGDL